MANEQKIYPFRLYVIFISLSVRFVVTFFSLLSYHSCSPNAKWFNRHKKLKREFLPVMIFINNTKIPFVLFHPLVSWASINVFVIEASFLPLLVSSWDRMKWEEKKTLNATQGLQEVQSKFLCIKFVCYCIWWCWSKLFIYFCLIFFQTTILSFLF